MENEWIDGWVGMWVGQMESPPLPASWEKQKEGKRVNDETIKKI